MSLSHALPIKTAQHFSISSDVHRLQVLGRDMRNDIQPLIHGQRVVISAVAGLISKRAFAGEPGKLGWVSLTV